MLHYWETPVAPRLRCARGSLRATNRVRSSRTRKAMAERLARENNNAKVPCHNASANAEPNVNDLASIDLNETQGVGDTVASSAASCSACTGTRHTARASDATSAAAAAIGDGPGAESGDSGCSPI